MSYTSARGKNQSAAGRQLSVTEKAFAVPPASPREAVLAQGDLSTARKFSSKLLFQKVSNLILKNPETALAGLWIKLSDDTRRILVGHMVHYNFLRFDEKAFADRFQRLDSLIVDAKREIKLLKKALNDRRRFEEIPGLGTIVVTIDLFGRREHIPLSQNMESEILRLNKFLGGCRRLYNRKRFGTFHNNIRLIFAQELVRHWSLSHLREELILTPTDIANLIYVVLQAGGVKTRDSMESELIRKAIEYFQKNKANQEIFDLIRQFPHAFFY
jgi:hypothetical protein